MKIFDSSVSVDYNLFIHIKKGYVLRSILRGNGWEF